MKIKHLHLLAVLLGFTFNTLAQNQSVPTNGLVGFYHLDGSASDSSGNNNNGTLHSVPPVSDRFGRSGKACYFNGSSGYIDIPTSASLQPMSSVSINAWIKPDSVSNAACVISKRFSLTADPYHSYELTYNPNQNRWAFAISKGLSGTLKLLNSKMYYPWGNWIFLSGTYDGTTMKLYINGDLDTSFAASGNLGYGAVPLYIGYSGASTDYFKGSIDEVTIYNRALTPQEIASMYAGNVGIERVSEIEQSLSLYPNPANNFLHFEVDKVMLGNYLITNIAGIEIQSGTFQKQIDISNLNKGIYIVSLIDKEAKCIKTFKFVKD